MKKKLNELFDTAKPQELDPFTDELNAPELPDKILASVKSKVYSKTNLKKAKNINTSVWLRAGTIAACFMLIVSTVIVVPMLREDQPDVIQGSDTADDPIVDPPVTNDPFQNTLGSHDGITISEALAQAITQAENNERISVKLQATDMIDVYASDYVDRLYDGKTYDEWWAEYEVYTTQMIEIEAQLKYGPDTVLENEFNTLAEKAEGLAEYMSQIQKKQKEESVSNELAWLKAMGIEAQYKKGYFVFSAAPDEIQNIRKGKCDYYIDIEYNTQESVEEPH